MKAKKKITEYMKIKKISSQYGEMYNDIKQMNDILIKNKRVLKSIRNDRHKIIQNYKDVAESHVARREYALSRQKNKLENAWNKLNLADRKSVV